MGSKAELLDAAAPLLRAAGCEPVVHAVLPLAEARRAHEMMEASAALRQDRARRWRDASRPFAPAPLAAGGHRQTLLGFWRRRRLRWDAPAEDLVVDAGDDVRLLAARDLAAGTARARPALVLVHGLGGCDAAGYALATGRLAWRRGWHVARMNMRGAGDAEALCAAPLQRRARRRPRWPSWPRWPRARRTLAVVGFSLGANLALLALGRGGDAPPARRWSRVAAVSPPLDLAACADALDRPANRLYQRTSCATSAPPTGGASGGGPTCTRRAASAASARIREYDDAITAPYGGYRGRRRVLRALQRGPAARRASTGPR